MREPVIIFDHVSKNYSLYHHIIGGLKNFLFHLPRTLNSIKNSRYKALKDVSFEVYKGETLGIVGRNGAGKSTILGLIAGVLKPSGGRVIVKGQVAALLELGAGFHPELTGRENILLYGVLMGLTRSEVAKKMDDIIKFSEIGEFIDQPIRVYSNGMLVRLGFSVVIYTDQNLLLIDEVLAVGDEAFQKKSKVALLRRIKKSRVTTILVTHDLTAAREMCSRVIWLDEGEIRAEGNPKKVVNEYRAHI